MKRYACIIMTVCGLACSCSTLADIPIDVTHRPALLGFAPSDNCSDPISVTEDSALDFGLYLSSSDGVYLLDSNGTTSEVGANLHYLGGASRGVFSLDGQDGCEVSIATSSDVGAANPIDDQAATTIGNGTDTIPFFTMFETSIDPVIFNGPAINMYVGGALQTKFSSAVQAAQPLSSGSYTGTYTIIVEYA